MPDENTPILTPDELREIKTNYNKAKDVLEKISGLTLKYNTAFSVLESYNTSSEKAATDIQERFNTIETMKNDSTAFFLEIKGNLEKTQTSIDQIAEGLQRFENIKGKVEGREGEIDTLIATANSLKNDIETAKASAVQRLADIDAQFTIAQEKITQIQGAYEGFIALQTKFADENTGLQAILNHATTLQESSDAILADIKNFHEESKKHLEQIERNKNSSDQLKVDIEAVLVSVKENESRVKEVTDLITDTGFANSFQSREKTIRKSLNIWLWVFIISILALSVMLFYLFKDFFVNVPEFNIVLYRLTLTSPLLLLIGFAIKQYNVERDLNERYAFKATIAAVMRNHSDFLIETTEKAGVEDSDFIRNTLGSLYYEPYEKGIDPKHIREELKNALNEKNLSKKHMLSDMVTKAKELKDLIPDDETLRSVVNLLSKIK
ncbi:MAG: hypothetical protein V4478_02875 [Patescibacteria group bacterium]